MEIQKEQSEDNEKKNKLITGKECDDRTLQYNIVCIFQHFYKGDVFHFSDSPDSLQYLRRGDIVAVEGGDQLFKVCSMKPFSMVEFDWTYDSRVLWPIDDFENKQYCEVRIYNFKDKTPSNRINKTINQLKQMKLVYLSNAARKYEIIYNGKMIDSLVQ